MSKEHLHFILNLIPYPAPMMASELRATFHILFLLPLSKVFDPVDLSLLLRLSSASFELILHCSVLSSSPPCQWSSVSLPGLSSSHTLQMQSLQGSAFQPPFPYDIHSCIHGSAVTYLGVPTVYIFNHNHNPKSYSHGSRCLLNISNWISSNSTPLK